MIYQEKFRAYNEKLKTYCTNCANFQKLSFNNQTYIACACAISDPEECILNNKIKK